MGMNVFAYVEPLSTTFKVKNIITKDNRCVNVFNYPIPVGTTRDLLRIPGIAEGEIRASLLKGELLTKLLAQELYIVESDIDLLQFNADQLALLTQYGLVIGGTVYPGSVAYDDSKIRTDALLIGDCNGVNNIFTVPNMESFINDGYIGLHLYWNGVRQNNPTDFSYYGSDNNAVIMVQYPDPGDIISADYTASP